MIAANVRIGYRIRLIVFPVFLIPLLFRHLIVTLANYFYPLCLIFQNFRILAQARRVQNLNFIKVFENKFHEWNEDYELESQ